MKNNDRAKATESDRLPRQSIERYTQDDSIKICLEIMLKDKTSIEPHYNLTYGTIFFTF